MSQQLTLLAFITAKPGKEEELGRVLEAVVAPTRAEAGCINYDLHRSQENPAVWMFYENWRSDADLETHFETPHLKAFLARKDELLACDMELRRFSMTTQAQPPKV
jgi:quinol monooxygenase YgiN